MKLGIFLIWFAGGLSATLADIAPTDAGGALGWLIILAMIIFLMWFGIKRIRKARLIREPKV